jgi:hypothetical protein
MIKEDAETGIEEIERSFALRKESGVAAFLGEHSFLLPPRAGAIVLLI